SSARAHWQSTSAGVYAIALYTPPERIADSSAIDVSLHFTATTILPSDPTTVQEVTGDIALRRAPILFVHGMWANKTTWGAAYIEADPRFDKYYADYSWGQPARNAMSFAASGDVIRDTVANIMQEHRSRRIACTQAVIVAHSMGGLLTRQHMADLDGLSNRRPDNFGQGDIHKFITMGTPHWGSPIAWLTKSLRDHTNPLIQLPFLELINVLGMDIFSGAIDGMCPNSADLQDLGEISVPTHTIQGWFLDGTDADVSLTGLLSSIFESTFDTREGFTKATPLAALLAALGYFAETSVDALYMFDKADFLVTNTGQSGGILNLGATSVFENTTHMALGTNLSPLIENETDSAIIAAHVFGLMDEPLDGAFGEGLPATESQNSEIECQAPAPSQLQAIRLAALAVPQITESLAILTPLNRQIVHPGDIVTVTTEETDMPLISALFLSHAEVMLIEDSPFQTQMEVPADTVGEFSIAIAARDLMGNVRIGQVTLQVEQTAELNELIVEPAGLFMKPGMRLNLRVDGLFSDGVTRPLTTPRTGTLYQSANEQIVTVDEQGTVEFQGMGETVIWVTNGEVEQMIKVQN
ncbi:MAG: alpha/beta fold hydrolase, partial [Phycisphaeraceae bacterium]|nr:alpha/beta fold hydrolase [Phycisphaeraceae bacterium]